MAFGALRNAVVVVAAGVRWVAAKARTRGMTGRSPEFESGVAGLSKRGDVLIVTRSAMSGNASLFSGAFEGGRGAGWSEADSFGEVRYAL